MSAADNRPGPRLSTRVEPSRYERLRRALRGRGLPIGEAMHPVTLAAVIVLAVNDWILKPRADHAAWTGAVTGKLSDIAGLAFAPVVLSAAIGLVLLVAARLGARVAPSLTRRRLIACIAATGAVFAAIKLGAPAATWFEQLIGLLGRPAEVYLDRTDLLCLPMLAVAWWIGRDELRRLAVDRAAPGT